VARLRVTESMFAHEFACQIWQRRQVSRNEGTHTQNFRMGRESGGCLKYTHVTDALGVGMIIPLLKLTTETTQFTYTVPS